PPPTSAPLPYTTLFRSDQLGKRHRPTRGEEQALDQRGQPAEVVGGRHGAASVRRRMGPVAVAVFVLATDHELRCLHLAPPLPSTARSAPGRARAPSPPRPSPPPARA